MEYRLVAVDVSPQMLVNVPDDYVVVGVQYTQSKAWQVLCLAPIASRGIGEFTLEDTSLPGGSSGAEVSS